MMLNINVDFRDTLGNVRNQGRRPTCLAFAASDVHRHVRNHPNLLCVEWLFYHTCKHAGTGSEVGITIPDTRTVLEILGQPEESAWPYRTVQPDPITWFPPLAPSTLLTCRSSNCAPVSHAVRTQIDVGTPVVVALFTSRTFDLPETWQYHGSEVILGRDLEEPIDYNRGHAVVVVGSGTVSGVPILLLKNSWGSNRGYNGHAWVHEDYLDARLADMFVILEGDVDIL